MFYKQFLTIIDVLNPDFVESFDYWLATLPRNNQKNITASVVSSRLGAKYSLAESILKFAEKQHILESYYLVKCPDCDYNLDIITKDEVADVLINPVFCDECGEDKKITLDDIYVAYKVIQQADVSEDEIARAIDKKLKQSEESDANFFKAEFIEQREKLDLDYGKNTTAKGKALETLVLEIFNQIRYVRGTNDVKTKTNQFDCTLLCGVDTIYLSVFNYLSPFFIIECKNEKEKPDNTYINKLQSIMDTNDAQFGIVFGRKDATKPCFEISREHYLLHKTSNKQQIIITCSDEDLKYIIDKKVNLLKYLHYKIMQIICNSPTATYEMFMKEQHTWKDKK